MSDFANFLPLSLRAAYDESRVSGDWRPLTAQCFTALIRVLLDCSDEEWDSPALRPGWTVRAVTAELIWRAEGSRVDLTIDRFRAVFRDPATPDPDLIRLAATPSSRLLQRMGAIAARRSERVGRRGVGDLSDVVSRSYEIARSLGRDLELPAVATGAVCLAQLLVAPLPIRAAIAGYRLEASDAGWTVGRGRALAAPAEQHVLFLFGRRGSLPGA